MEELTKDAQKLLCILYKEYKERRNRGLSKSKSISFISSKVINETLCPDALLDDVEMACRELKAMNMISGKSYDNYLHIIELQDHGIITAENRFKNGLIEVADFISKFIP